MTATPDRAAFAFVGAFVDELARAGVRHASVAPGSRSTPLALALARHPAIRIWTHLDERSAGFFALGMARELGAPVALLCTSGTAAANFLPAVAEAAAAEVPLLVLTADRPPELRDVGAAQTIDQARLYGTHAKWFVDVALPEISGDLLRYGRTLGARAAARAAAVPAGPVHLNFPFREPLVPTPVGPPASASAADALAWEGRPDAAPWVVVSDALPAADAATVARLAALLGAARRPLIVCGPQYDAGVGRPLARVARALGAPLLADPLSQLRWAPGDRTVLVDRYDAALRHERTAERLAPDVVLRIGAVPTSKPLLQLLQRAPSHIVVDAARWPDPMLMAMEVVHASPRGLAESLATACDRGNVETGWLERWRDVNDCTAAALTAHAAALAEPFEGAVLAAVAALLPSGATCFVSSSMPVRDLDAFGAGDARSIRVLANRGANGIDGVVSTALGVAAAQGPGAPPLVLVIGDMAFYHDMNGLLAAKLHGLDATIVVINNDGGGIFSFLPQAAEAEHFERLFGTPHGLTFEHAAALYGARHVRVHDVAALRTAVTAGLGARGLQVVEIRTDRTRNVALHRDAWTAVGTALDALDD